MRIFISWGSDGKPIAAALRELLRNVIDASSPWMSDLDITSGAVGDAEIMGALDDASIGIVVVTPSSRSREWVLWEAGALSMATAVASPV